MSPCMLAYEKWTNLGASQNTGGCGHPAPGRNATVSYLVISCKISVDVATATCMSVSTMLLMVLMTLIVDNDRSS